jgi:hypothetical protein
MARRRLPCGVRPGRGRRPCLRELALDAAQAHFILLSTIAKAILRPARARRVSDACAAGMIGHRRARRGMCGDAAARGAGRGQGSKN